MEKKPWPRYSNTAGQQAAREAFTTANDEWKLFDAESKPYFEKRASQLGITPRNLYCRAKIEDLLPLHETALISEILDVQMFDRSGFTNDDFNIEFDYWSYGAGSWIQQGVFDVETGLWQSFGPNAYTAVLERVIISNSVPLSFRNGWAVRYKDNSSVEKTFTLRCMDGISPASPADQRGLMLDGTLATDLTYDHIWATDNF